MSDPGEKLDHDRGEPRVESEESSKIASNLGKTARTDFVREMLSKPEVSLEDIRRASTDFFMIQTIRG